MTVDALHGFTASDSLSNHDHLFSKFLKRHKALDNGHANGNSHSWYAPDGRVVATAIYDNSACTYRVWVRSDLA